MEVVQFVPQLGKALWNLKVMYDQYVENGNEIKELQSFIQDYGQQIPILRERFQESGGNVMGIAAFKNLEKDVMEATNKLERWLRNKSFFRLFNSTERMLKLGKLHSKVMASVQKSLGIANLSMLLDLQATQATILESNVELKSLLITSIESMHGTLPTQVRDEVVEASTSSFGDPKFWEDVLVAVDNHNGRISSFKDKNMYEDPITTNLMIDPVVASDGNTYCRWTIIDNNLTTNPFNVDEDLTIVIDNLTLRRGLFEKFPKQAQIFLQRRDDYRSHAFSLKAKGLLGDALLALEYILQWDKRDVECVEALREVQGALQEAKEKYLQPCNHNIECVEALEQVQGARQEAKEKYLQPSMVLSNEPGNGRPISSSMNEMVVGTLIELHEAYKLFPNLSSSIPEVRQQAAYSICQWSKRDVKFQSYIVQHGGIPLLAALLPSSNQITQNYVLSVLLDISWSSHKHRTMLGTTEPNFPDALESIAEVLKEGSSKARKQAARILFYLSEGSTEACKQASRVLFYLSKHSNGPSNGWSDIWYPSMVMHALVISLGNGSLQVQQIVSGTLNNLFHDIPNQMQAIGAGLVPVLLKLIARKTTTMLEEALPLVNEVMNFWCRSESHRAIRIEATPTTWLEIMASKFPLHQERAASILYTLCYEDQEYHQQTRECQALEQIAQFSLYGKTKHNLIELLNSNVSYKIYPIQREIPFLKKYWWSPKRDERRALQ